MPFSSDTAWPQGLRTIFDICRKERGPVEYRYFGPYDRLLNYCFGDSDSFQFFVSAQSPRDLNLGDTVDFAVFLVVFDANRRPVLFAEIEDGRADKPDLRHRADNLIRRGYDAMLGDCPLPRLWGLSLLDTSLRVYCGTVATGRIEPDFAPRPSPGRVLPQDYSEGAWDIDILSPEGFNKIKEIITDVLAAAAL